MASLARGLEVLQAFTPQRRVMSVSQISQRTGIPRAAVRRCLYTLSKLGFVYAEDGKTLNCVRACSLWVITGWAPRRSPAPHSRFYAS